MSSAATTRFPLFPLLVISGAIFVSVTSEFLPTGLLPDIAGELEVSESQVGLLVTIFATTVVVTAAPLAALTKRYSRKWLMVVTLSVFTVANVLAAIAPSYELLAATRVLAGSAHGLFWAVTGPYASRLVPRQQLSRALAITNAGGTVAFVVGVPVGTALGHALGWRLAFAVMGFVVLAFLLLVIAALPPVKHLEPLATGEIPIPARRDRTVPAVAIVCATVLIVLLGQNAYYTYIVPWMTQVGAIDPGAIGGLLFVYGAAGALGLVAAGLAGDRFPRASALVAIGGVAASVAFLGGWGEAAPVIVVVGLVLWSAAFGGIPALMQTRLLHAASPRIRDIGSAWLTVSFNVAIGGGALLGGVLLDGFGIRALPWALVVLVVAGFAFVLATDRVRLAAERH